MRPARVCSIDGCEKSPRTAKAAWCKMHYHRWYRHGDPLHRSNAPHSDHCKIEGCAKPGRKRGWCGMHYERWRRTGEIGVSKSRFFTGDERCRVPGCGKSESARSYCVGHYSTFVGGPLRRARLADATVLPFSSSELAQRLSMYGGRCWICGGREEAVDHVKPIAKGGAHMLANLRPICVPCNSAKWCRWPFDPAQFARSAA